MFYTRAIDSLELFPKANCSVDVSGGFSGDILRASSVWAFIANRTCIMAVTGSFCIRYSQISHDPVIYPVIGPLVLSRNQSECLSRPTYTRLIVSLRITK